MTTSKLNKSEKIRRENIPLPSNVKTIIMVADQRKTMIGLGGGDRKRTIHDCALEGDIVALENLVREKPTLLRSKDDSGREAFHWAVSRLFCSREL